MVNLAEPERALEVASMNVDGVGLLRAEFMIAQIGVHPRYAIKHGLTKKYIDNLVDGLVQFCKAFGTRPVIYRATDFKSNEYKNLKGGAEFETPEENPMIGYRGAFRYVKEPDEFALELEAIKKVRNVHGHKNLHLMIPFVRSPKELAAVKQLITAAGLHRSSNFHLYMMAEIPTNVIQLEEFAKVGIDGISVGSNDLTQLTLGVDRDSGKMAEEFNELDEAVLWSLERLGREGRKLGLSVGICGQAPSVYPDLAEKLVNWGYSYVSVSPDVIDTVRVIIANSEHKLTSKRK
jgi:pyruvate,water dikinase